MKTLRSALVFLGIALPLTGLVFLFTAATATDPTSATVSAPNLVAVSTTATTAILARTNDPAGHSFLRVMQNVGTVPVLYALGSTVAVTNYHGVLAPCSAARDGLGSLVDLSYWRGTVSVMCESGSGTVSAVEILK